LKVLSYADYYPFGWEMPGRQYTAAGADQQHGYQGDYARKNPDLVWNSFKLRNFDSRLGRWLSVDPAAQYHSLYMAMDNNPISVFDPDGAYAYKNAEGNTVWFDDMDADQFTLDGATWTLVSKSLDRFVKEFGGGEWNFFTTESYAGPNAEVVESENAGAALAASVDDANWHNNEFSYNYYSSLFEGNLESGILVGNGVGLDAYRTLNKDFVERRDALFDAVEQEYLSTHYGDQRDFDGALELADLLVFEIVTTGGALRTVLKKAIFRQGGKELAKASAGSIKNISGSLDDAAQLARNQPYGPVNNVFRRLPKSAQDVLALEGAQAGKGRLIMENLSDPRYTGWEKWHYSVGPKGSKSVVHYIRNPETGYLTDFKFK
jgi:RHS repeat-associated protein